MYDGIPEHFLTDQELRRKYSQPTSFGVPSHFLTPSETERENARRAKNGIPPLIQPER